MFPKARNIERSFQYIRFFTLFIILVCFLICTYCLYQSFVLASSVQDRIYVLSGGKVMEAVASGKQDNIPVEARDHIRMFHTYFFSLDPDEKVILSNITKALYLADGSAKQEYTNLKEKGYYNSVIAGNISQSIEIDSVSLDVQQYPYYFKCFATQLITRSTSVVTRSLVTDGYFRNTSRSDNNPHGFLIERWTILENRDVNISNR
ncbi:MAG: conjugative transposon protein TraK [Pseudobacter sp.]|uniref:conjugative transposon protein TraK n=1 Tax=Pseudobacter sp. TaxID=2045420 RepID=UPI003F81C1B2